MNTLHQTAEAAAAAAQAGTLLKWAGKTFDWVTTSRLPGIGSAEDLARSHLRSSRTIELQIKNLIHWQMAKTGMFGFAANMGGLPLMPLTVPADLAQLFAQQTRMAAAIAFLCGVDPRAREQFRIICIACALGISVRELLHKAGIELIAHRLLWETVSGIGGLAMSALNQAVGLKLTASLAGKSSAGLSRAVPVISGIVGGTLNALSTKAAGEAAQKTFLELGRGLPESERYVLSPA